jgi:pimeloyl-ACP methyl ester carboxylesterase
LFSKNTKGSHPEMVQELISLSENLSPEALIQYTKAMIKREDTTSVLKSFPKPILFIVGIHDEAVPLEASLNQCYLPKIAQVNFLQKSGHLGMWEQQELATKFLKGFLTFADSFG